MERMALRKSARTLLLLVFSALLIVTAAGCRRETRPTKDGILVKPAAGPLEEKTAKAQDRIAKAFYASIVPNLKKCWGQVGGKGAVRFVYTYKREGQRWVFGQVDSHATSLEREQTVAALRCMREAARGSSYPVESEEAAQNTDEMEIYWGWPVPLPNDTTELARMIVISTTGDACLKLCKDCTMNATCDRTCSGWFGCEPVDGGCQMDGKKSCKTGWSGSLAGTVMH
jgi:hypothetical protein